MHKNKIKTSLGSKIFDTTNVLLMLAITVIMLYPFWYCIIVSFNDARDLTVNGVLGLLPRVFTLENYDFILNNEMIGTAAVNSVLRTVIGTVLHCVVTGAAAYGLNKKNLMGRKFYTSFFVVTMYFSGGMIPTYLLIRALGLLDNFLVYVIPGMFSFYNAILFMSFYDSIPPALEEAAVIDGAGMWTVFFKIIIPVSKPIFATVALYSIVGQWNSWMDTVLYVKSDDLVTLQSVLMKMVKHAESLQSLLSSIDYQGAEDLVALAKTIKPLSVQVATMVVTTFPIVMIYPFFQKYFVKGIMLGSVKE